MSGKKLLQLFFNMLYISAFTFGGGFVIITLMKQKFADELGWLDEQEMLDLAALSQASPGAIAVNAAILVGWRTAGAAGITAAVAGTILPPLGLLSVISFFYASFISNPYVVLALKGMQAGVAAVIFDVVWNLGQNVWEEKSIASILLMSIAFIAAFLIIREIFRRKKGEA